MWPMPSGKPGCVRSNAWHCDFSSQHKTSALSGGLRYSPMTSQEGTRGRAISRVRRMTAFGQTSPFRAPAGRSGIVKGFRTPASHGRVGMHGGRRPKSLEGGNRGEFAPAVVQDYYYRPVHIKNSRSSARPMRRHGWLEQLGDALLEPLFPVVRGIRLLGISMSSLGAE